jgi:hypothetical protein
MLARRLPLAPVVVALACSSSPSVVGSTDDAGTADSSTTTSGRGESEAGSTTDEPGSSTSSVDPGSTTGDETTGSTGRTDACTPPDPTAAWMEAYQDEIVARLSGLMPLPSGEMLTERSTPTNRAQAVDYLFDAFGELGLEPELHEYSGEAVGTNVFARLPATNGSTEFIVIGAHFDTVPGSPGANDNATGVALVLSLARYLSSVPCRELNVVFVLFDQEEIGLVGSFEFAGLLDGNGLDVVAAHTVDQMGWDADEDRTIELERADAGLLDFYATSAAERSVPLSPTTTGLTDHVSFRDWGFAAVGLTEEFVGGDTTPHYHLGTDTYDTVDFDYLASTTVVVHAAFAAALAPAGTIGG